MIKYSAGPGGLNQIEVLNVKAGHIQPLLIFGGLDTKTAKIPVVLEKSYFDVKERRQYHYKQVMSTAIVALLECSTLNENEIGTLWSILQPAVLKRLDKQAEPSQVLAEVISAEIYVGDFFPLPLSFYSDD